MKETDSRDMVSVGLDIGSSMTKVVYRFLSGKKRTELRKREIGDICFPVYFGNSDHEFYMPDFVEDSYFSKWMLPTRLDECGKIAKGYKETDKKLLCKKEAYHIKDDFVDFVKFEMDEDKAKTGNPYPYIKFMSLLMNYLEFNALKDFKIASYTLGCPKVLNATLNYFRTAMKIAYDLREKVVNLSDKDFEDEVKNLRNLYTDKKRKKYIDLENILNMDDKLLNDEKKLKKENVERSVCECFSVEEKKGKKIEELYDNFLKILPEDMPDELEVLPEILGEALVVSRYQINREKDPSIDDHYYIFDAGNSTFDTGAVVSIKNGIGDADRCSVVFDKMNYYEDGGSFDSLINRLDNEAHKRMPLNPWNMTKVGVYGGRRSELFEKVEKKWSTFILCEKVVYSDENVQCKWLSDNKTRFYVAAGLTWGAKQKGRPIMFITDYFDRIESIDK